MIQALIEDKMEKPSYAFAQAGYKVTINRLPSAFNLDKISIIVIFPFDRNFEW
jgi:hypothetical protein